MIKLCDILHFHHMELKGKYSHFSNQENRIWLNNSLCVFTLQHLLMFSFQHGRRPRTPPPSVLLHDETESERGPIRSRSHSQIRWHKHEEYYIFLRLSPDPLFVWPLVVNLHWLLSCRGCKDPDTLWRTWFADNRVKNRDEGFLFCEPCALLVSVTTW